MKEDDNNILGCFVSGPSLYHDADRQTEDIATEKAEIFRGYIWGQFGICDSLKTLNRNDYGKDLKLALLKFYVLPLIEMLAVIRDIERYRPKERAIGIPIIVHDYNFFDKSDRERRRFLKQTIREKLDLLAGVVKRNKLDTDIGLLKADVEKLSF